MVELISEAREFEKVSRLLKYHYKFFCGGGVTYIHIYIYLDTNTDHIPLLAHAGQQPQNMPQNMMTKFTLIF